MKKREYLEIVYLQKMREFHRTKAECEKRKTELGILHRLIMSMADHEAAIAASNFPNGTAGGEDGEAQ